MKSGIRKVALFGTTYGGKCPATALMLLKVLENEGYEVTAEGKFRDLLPPDDSLSGIDSPAADVDLVVSIGGDGTFLRAAQWVADSGIPIVGVNTGHLGFLATYNPDEIPSLPHDIATGKLRMEPRELLKIDMEGLPEGFWPYALNEVAILKEDTSSMIDIRTEINSFFLTNYRGDGLVVATPTGSTGYNLSLGGPVMQPSLGNWILSPIAPHTLTMRPLVVDSGSEITALTTSRADTYRVSLDGRSFVMPCGTLLRISRAPFRTFVAVRLDENFASTLRKKLYWGGPL